MHLTFLQEHDLMREIFLGVVMVSGREGILRVYELPNSLTFLMSDMEASKSAKAVFLLYKFKN